MHLKNQILWCFVLIGFSMAAVTASPPIITRQPVDVEVPLNGTARFSVGAASDSPMNFQWRFNGIRLFGANSRELVLANVAAADVGEYTVDVSNSLGLVVSEPARLTLFVDTDRDGLSDNYESGIGRYKLLRDANTWEQAHEIAKAQGWHLATITSEAEWKIVSSIFTEEFLRANGILVLFLGASDRQKEGGWEWVTGEPWSFEKWSPGEPNNSNGNEMVLNLWGYSNGPSRPYGFWNDLITPVADEHAFLLEQGFFTDPDRADTDGDGLSDFDEVRTYQTFPNFADSDSDGLSDKEELAAGTNPLAADSDKDGVSDGDEKIYSTNPISADTDGDGLSDRFEIRYGRYQIIEGQFTWNEARNDAKSRGGHLATITSADEWEQILADIGRLFENRKFWLGATDEITEGDWKWVTEEPFVFQLWHSPSREPNNTNGNEHYMELYSEFGTWNDLPDIKDANHGYLLEKDFPVIDPRKADSDGDGFSDGAEVLAGKNPADINETPAGVIRVYHAVEVEFYPSVGKRYQIQASSDLKEWTDFGDEFVGDGNAQQRLLSTRPDKELFFRVEEVR